MMLLVTLLVSMLFEQLKYGCDSNDGICVRCVELFLLLSIH